MMDSQLLLCYTSIIAIVKEPIASIIIMMEITSVIMIADPNSQIYPSFIRVETISFIGVCTWPLPYTGSFGFGWHRNNCDMTHGPRAHSGPEVSMFIPAKPEFWGAEYWGSYLAKCSAQFNPPVNFVTTWGNRAAIGALPGGKFQQ